MGDNGISIRLHLSQAFSTARGKRPSCLLSFYLCSGIRTSRLNRASGWASNGTLAYGTFIRCSSLCTLGFRFQKIRKSICASQSPSQNRCLTISQSSQKLDADTQRVGASWNHQYCKDIVNPNLGSKAIYLFAATYIADLWS